MTLRTFRRLLLAALASTLVLTTMTGLGAGAVFNLVQTNDRHRPTAPRVFGPRTTTNLTPRYRFSAHEKGTPARLLRFRCAFDSPVLRACPRRSRAQLTLGRHLLSVRALDRAGHHSRLTVVRVLVEPAAVPAHVLATASVTDAGSMTFGADGSVWVNRTAGSPTGKVSRIDPATNQVTASITVSQSGPEVGGGCDIEFGFGSVWVVNFKSSSVSRIDPATNSVLTTISTETGSGSYPCGVAITPQAVWVAKHEPVGSIVKINPSTNHIVDEIPVGQPSPVGGPAWITAADGSVWGDGPGAVDRLDPLSDQVVAQINCAGNGGFRLASDGVALWASNCTGGLGGISRIDPVGNTIRTVVPVSALEPYITRCTSGCIVPYGVALTFGGGTLWALGQCGSSTCVLGINPETSLIVSARTVPLAQASGLAYGDGSLWVAGGNSVLRIDPGS